MKNGKWKTTILILLIPALICSGCSYEEGEWVSTDQEAVSSEEAERDELSSAADKTAASKTSSEEEEQSEQNTIFVYICGEVAVSGVYELPEGSRLYELIRMAGGLTDQADERAINQASVLSDGDQIIVYAVGEAAASRTGETEGSGLININTASEAELQTLSGIGESKAKAIVAWREENGSFSEKEDIMQVSGIGEGLYGKIKDQITV